MKRVPVTSPLKRAAEAVCVAATVQVVLFSLAYYYQDCRCARSSTAMQDSLERFYCPKTCETDGNIETTTTYNAMGTLVFNPLEEAMRHLFHQACALIRTRGWMHASQFGVLSSQVGNNGAELGPDSPPFQFSVLHLLLLFAVYLVLSCWTYGIAVPSGLFVPSLLTGALGGRAFGETLSRCGFTVDPGLYALVGAAAMLGGMTRMTISLCCILIETTDGIKFGLPITTALLFAKWAGDYFNDGLYDIHISLKEAPILYWTAPHEADLLLAKHIMSKQLWVLPERVKVRDAVDILARCLHNGFPVVSTTSALSDGNRAHALQGLVLRHQVCVLIASRAFYPDLAACEETKRQSIFDEADMHYPRYPSIHAVSLKLIESELDMYLDLRPVMNSAPFIIQHWASAQRCFALFRTMGLRHLCVIDERHFVVGVITRKDLTASWILEQQQLATEAHIRAPLLNDSLPGTPIDSAHEVGMKH
jgi:CBS domain-containing protein